MSTATASGASLHPTTSLTRKFVMALTGAGLCGFVLVHMTGNLLILKSSDAYNAYSHALTSNQAFLYTAEIGLLVIFIAHVVTAIQLAIHNRASRPERYAMKPNGAKGPSPASQFMVHTGVVVFIFVIIHLLMFKYGEVYWTEVDGVKMRDLYRLVVEEFHEPLDVVFYSICVLILGVHLSHGFQSLFQSLGINHPTWTPRIKKLGRAFAAFVAVGFLIQPLYVYFLVR